jgi:hypothetical protein
MSPYMLEIDPKAKARKSHIYQRVYLCVYKLMTEGDGQFWTYQGVV